MKILFVNSDCGLGSTGRICTDLADELKDNGHTVRIAYGRELNQKYSNYAIRIGNKTDVYLHGALSRLFDYSGFGSTQSTKLFLRWVKEYDPDIIHIHNIHGYYVNVEKLFEYLKYSNKRIIWTLHDCWPFTGHSAFCDAIGCEKWMMGCRSCPQLNEYPKSYLDRSERNWERKKKSFTGIRNMIIATPSEWLGNMVKRSFLFQYPVCVINNGVDTKVFHPTKSSFKEQNKIEDKVVLLAVSSVWNDLKGFSDYVKLAKLLPSNYVIVMVGVNENLAKLLPSNILPILKTQNALELAGIYSAADLFVNLTYCDTYPTVNIEALACGLPILTYKTGGSTEIAEKYCGVVVEKGDIGMVAKEIQRMVLINKEHKPLYNTDVFDKKHMIDEYMNLYFQNQD